MPCDYAVYPPTWASEIRPAILARAHHACEGSPAYPDCRARNHEPHPVTGSTVILTISHTCQCVPICSNYTHLLALCQRCHLAMDLSLHQRHAAETRRRTREAAGQLSFLE
jgi:hypothetical protein